MVFDSCLTIACRYEEYRATGIKGNQATFRNLHLAVVCQDIDARRV